MPNTFVNAVVTDPGERVAVHVNDGRASLHFDAVSVQTHSDLTREQQAAYWRRVADAAARIAIELGEPVPVSAQATPEPGLCPCGQPGCSDEAVRR